MAEFEGFVNIEQEGNAFEESDCLPGLQLSSLESLVLEDGFNVDKLQALHNKKRIQQIMLALKIFCSEFDQQCLDAIILNVTEDLKQTGDNIGRYQQIKRKLGQIRDCFLKVADVADTVFDWLEENGSNIEKAIEIIKKQEGLLQGIVQIADLAQKSASFAFLQLSCSLLEGFGTAWKEKLSFIESTLKEIGDKQEEITEEVRVACVLLEEIVHTSEWVQSKAGVFDNHVRKCVIAILKCQRHVEEAEKETNELLFKFNCVKWFERAIRMVSLAVSWSSIHECFVNEEVDKATALGACVISFLLCFASFPSSVREYCSEIKRLAMEHRTLKTELHGLKVSLQSAYSYRHKMERQRNNTL